MSRLGSVLAATLLTVGCKCSPPEPDVSATPSATVSGHVRGAAPSAPSYVGSQRCQPCHEPAYAAWQTSQHRLAMQEPTTQSVLGNFENRDFAHDNAHTRFRHDDHGYHVQTLGHSYDVKYTFGVRPLQQYLLDIGDGHLQAFTVASDTRATSPGAAPWYQLQPDERTQPGDELHWTSTAYSWNASCADCHSTNLQKRYDADRASYDTRYSEISVGCEACHGAGSRHAEQAASATFDASRGWAQRFARPGERHWTFTADQPIATLSHGSAASNELEVCAGCHSHRAELGGDSHEFYDRYRLDTLDRELYFPDGQQREETFEVGSFLQSKMYAAGVTCSDCHEPHSGATRRPGNALCGGCHAAAHYDTPSHHLHAAASPAAQCVSCHMPTHTFMQIDARREHRFSVPRPDLTLALGVPNPCTDNCHLEKRQGTKPGIAAAATWATDTIRTHFGAQREPSFAFALDAGQKLAKDGQAQLLALVHDARYPAIARATALRELRAYPLATLSEVDEQRRDPSPLVRRAYAELAGEQPADARPKALAPLLGDGARSVRIEAARGLVDVPRASLAETERARFDSAALELRQSLDHNADRPFALLELARLELAGSPNADAAAHAEKLFQRAIALEPSVAASYLSFADFLRERSRDAEASELLEKALTKCHDQAPLEHALGLTWVRRGDKPRGLEHLAKAYRLAPDSSRFGYVYAVALFDTGKRDQAITVLESLQKRMPGDTATLELLNRYRAR